MADRLGAGQAGKLADIGSNPAISGWSRRAGVPDCRTSNNRSTGRNQSCRHRPRRKTADQIAHRRHPARDQRQFPRTVRLLPVRLLRQRHRQGVLPGRGRDRGLAQHLRRVLARRPDAPGRRHRARRLYRPDRPPQGPDRDAGDHGCGTVIIAFCPTYASIGVAAPVIVLIGRLLQGFSAGVELGGVSVYLSEISTPGNQGFYTSFQSSSQQVAIFVAALIGYFLSETMPPASSRIGAGAFRSLSAASSSRLFSSCAARWKKPRNSWR